MSQTPTSRLPSGPAPKKGSPYRCVEIVGGNELRTEVLILGGLEVLLVARPAGSPGGGGGDIYCIHSCGHGALAKFVLLDLTGHGQERDAIARSVRDLLHLYDNETRPARLLKLLNQKYIELALPPVLATAVSAVYDPGQGEFRFANAGHPRPIHWLARQHQWALARPAEESDCGLPLGVRETACYTEESIGLDVGDMLFLSSDGLPETRDWNDEFLEPEGVLRLLEKSTVQVRQGCSLVGPAVAFLRHIGEFHGRKGLEDDITLLWLRRLPAEPNGGSHD